MSSNPMQPDPIKSINPYDLRASLEADLKSIIKDSPDASGSQGLDLKKAPHLLKSVNKTISNTWSSKSFSSDKIQTEFTLNQLARTLKTMTLALDKIKKMDRVTECSLDLKLARDALEVSNLFTQLFGSIEDEEKLPRIESQQVTLQNFRAALSDVIVKQERTTVFRNQASDIPSFTYDAEQSVEENISRFKQEMLLALQHFPASIEKVNGKNIQPVIRANITFRDQFKKINLLWDPIDKLKAFMTLIYDIGREFKVEVGGDLFMTLTIDLFGSFPNKSCAFIMDMMAYTEEQIRAKRMENSEKAENVQKRKKLQEEIKAVEDIIPLFSPGSEHKRILCQRLSGIVQELSLLDATDYIFTQVKIAASHIHAEGHNPRR